MNRNTPFKIARVAVLGPESTGKTTLCRQLANHYQTVWVPEAARDYIGKLDRAYTEADILAIAHLQHHNESTMLRKANRLLFVDTEYIISKIWSEDRFGSCQPWVEKQLARHPHDLYLLTKPDLPWQPDPLRENPERREFLFERYRNELELRGFRFHVVSGTGPTRFQSALAPVEAFVAQHGY